MKNSVKVTINPATGLIFTSTGISAKDGLEYGFIRLETQWLDMSGPVAQVKKLSALKTMKKSDFEISGLEAGMELEGKIIIKESTTKNPFRSKQEPKRQGAEGGVLLLNGLPIYRETEFTTDEDAKNVLVAHTSVAPVEAGVENAAAKAKLV